MIRAILGVIVGAVAGGIFNMVVVVLSGVLHPPPAGTDLRDPEAIKAYMQTAPATAFLMILVAHAGGSFVGGLIAALIARKSPVVIGSIIGALFLVGGIANLFSIPHPTWFAVADVILYVPAGIAGAYVVGRSAQSPSPQPMEP